MIFNRSWPMSDVVLRLKCRTGTFPITVPLTLKVTDLIERAAALCNQPTAGIKLLMGFPPKPILRFEDSVEAVGLKSGDTIIVEVVPNSRTNVTNVKVDDTESSNLKNVAAPEVGDEMPLILRKIVPADNSCLFTSMGFVLGGNINLNFVWILRVVFAVQISVFGKSFFNRFVVGWGYVAQPKRILYINFTVALLFRVFTTVVTGWLPCGGEFTRIILTRAVIFYYFFHEFSIYIKNIRVLPHNFLWRYFVVSLCRLIIRLWLMLCTRISVIMWVLLL